MAVELAIGKPVYRDFLLSISGDFIIALHLCIRVKVNKGRIEILLRYRIPEGVESLLLSSLELCIGNGLPVCLVDILRTHCGGKLIIGFL